MREDEIESFFDRSAGRDGTYLRVQIKGDKSFKGRGWPWVQAGIRQVLGQEKLEKASILRDGALLLKTKNKTQTEKFLKITAFLGEDCEVQSDDKLNVSRGTIHAYDLLELSEEEVVQWLSEYGVTNAKRFTRRVGGTVENTPTLLLTFDMPSCPTKIELDYMTYQVKRHIPNPLICFRCGQFGHPEARCTNAERCLTCGDNKHDGDCVAKCLNCSQLGHSCLSRQCEVWQKEKDICTIKVEQEIPYGQARKIYEDSHRPPILQGYADVVRTPSVSQQTESDIKVKVERLERKIDEMASVLTQMAKQLKGEADSVADSSEQDRPTPAGETVRQVEGAGVRRVNLPGDTEGSQDRVKPTSSKKDVTRLLASRAGRGKGRGRDGKKTDMDTDDVQAGETPSQVIGRSMSMERGTTRSDSIGRRSWKDAND